MFASATEFDSCRNVEFLARNNSWRPYLQSTVRCKVGSREAAGRWFVGLSPASRCLWVQLSFRHVVVVHSQPAIDWGEGRQA